MNQLINRIREQLNIIGQSYGYEVSRHILLDYHFDDSITPTHRLSMKFYCQPFDLEKKEKCIYIQDFEFGDASNDLLFQMLCDECDTRIKRLG